MSRFYSGSFFLPPPFFFCASNLGYGEKSPDGKRFIKNQELRDAFAQTEAYSDLFMELATDAEAAARFINGIVPQGKKAPAPRA